MEENETLDNLEVGEEGQENNETLDNESQDNSHTAKEERYKQQIAGSKQEAERLRNLVIDREVKNAEKDARSLLELHDVDPKLADEVARRFGYDDFNDAKSEIDKKAGGDGVKKTQDATFEESFEKLYQERKAKELNEEALKRADKIIGKITDKDAREKAQAQFKKIVGNKQLTIDEAEEFAEMATLYVNKESLKAERYEEGIGNYASTGMGMGKKPGTGDGKVEVVRNGRIVILDANKQ